MNFYEYQTKALFRDYDIPVPQGVPITSAKDAPAAFAKLPGGSAVVKAQVLSGGRGKAGGIQFADNPEQAQKFAQDLIGKELTTFQSAGQGETIRTLYLEEKSSIAKSYYLGMLVDRDNQSVVVIASAEGGVEIEEIAANEPEKIITSHIPASGYFPHVGRTIGKNLGIDGKLLNSFAGLVGNLHRFFIENDGALLEINPLVLTTDNHIIALDAKFAADDNATYRQKKLKEIYDRDNIHAEDANERKANEIGVNYVSLDGNIGCMVNGAGLAMATMDMIKLCDGEPANFLDIGGGASEDQVRDAFKLLTSHDKVKGILVNIFGGIVHCDKVANGIVLATKELGLNLPVVVRLQGTRVDEGQQVLKDSNLDLTPADTMEEAAKLIVEKVGQ
jgi:succinyl-CoA synthetase beta subunit